MLTIPKPKNIRRLRESFLSFDVQSPTLDRSQAGKQKRRLGLGESRALNLAAILDSCIKEAGDDSSDSEDSLAEQFRDLVIDDDHMEGVFGNILRIMKEGDFFGELLLEGARSRTASAIAKENTEVLIVEKEDYINFFSSTRLQMEKEKIKNISKYFPLIKEMSKEVQLRFIYSMKQSVQKRGDIIFKEGEMTDKCLIIT